jgi:endonuclease/exonuclease/phosphatase (EEP) superfamily protein YafD
VLLRVGGDRWWFPTLMLFGPRWICAVPLAVLGPWAGFTRRRLWWPLSAAAVLVIGPIMGFCLPWSRLAAPVGPTVRVLTCNLKGQCQDNEALDELIRTLAPDVVALQGCWKHVRVDWPAGWHVRQQGDVLIASRYPLRELPEVDSARELRPRVSLLACLVAAPGHDLCFCTLHPQSPHHSIDPLLDRWTVLRPSQSPQLVAEIENRWRDARAIAEWLAGTGKPEIIAGDLNVPADSAIYRRYWTGYWNAFSSAGLGFGYTEWPKLRKVRFGMRIDHILSGPNWRPGRCWVGPDVGSDHLPLIADLYWAG